jgi:plastocyanin
MKPGRILPIIAVLMLGVSVSAQAATIQISMENLEIMPAQVSAKVGDTIEWINKDVLAHTATARNGDFDVIAAEENRHARCDEGRHVRILLPLPSQYEGKSDGKSLTVEQFTSPRRGVVGSRYGDPGKGIAPTKAVTPHPNALPPQFAACPTCANRTMRNRVDASCAGEGGYLHCGSNRT